MTTHEPNELSSKGWMIFIRIITVLGIPVGSWIIKTTMNTDKNIAVLVEHIKDMDKRIYDLENTVYKK